MRYEKFGFRIYELRFRIFYLHNSGLPELNSQGIEIWERLFINFGRRWVVNGKIVNCGMLDIIKSKLKEIEQQEKVHVLYACESGSRAWGFPSPDSDFDVRFIYARQVNDYLNITEKSDTIDLPVNEVLDIGGWDVRKALKLFLKSNGPLYEWLQSPIVYVDDVGFAGKMKQLMTNYFSLRAGGHHYLSMALNTLNEDLQHDRVKIKRCFYALRSTLACKWIVQKQTVPPMEFGRLREIETDKDLQSTIDDLLKIKSVSDEKMLMVRNPIINSWLEITLSDCRQAIAEIPATRRQPDELNEIFRKYIA